MAFIRVSSIANITRDPELRTTSTGSTIAQFGIAVNNRWKDSAGQVREDVTFVDVEAWDKLGETITKHFTKGKPIYIEGRLKQENWEDKATGAKRSKLKVVLERFDFIGSKTDEPTHDGAAPAPALERRRPPAATPPAAPPIDEDVPF